MKKMIITDWSALLKCSDCGHEHESRVYGRWDIDTCTITRCPICKRVTNHVIIGRIAETSDYDEYLENRTLIIK
ncbi:MAG TPA: hypothetical protein VMW03_05325 [Candidatus Krumholzibacteriaceae bacterium]|nr:hypothetical protein [Candidatus Krumholzibacteriaceae bacterium]